MNNTELKGRLMLKVVGILYIIFAALGILAGLVAIAGGAALGITGGGESLALGLGALAMILGFVAILSSVFSLVGILGVKWCNRPDKAGTLFVLGIILIVLAALSLLSSFSGDSSSSVVSGLIGLVLPVLYTLGAWQNKQSLQ